MTHAPDPSSATLDLFISHATADDPRVSKLDAALKAAGIATWVDHEHGIPSGDRWPAAIQDATLQCKAALYILTPESAKSVWCERELIQMQEHLKRKVYVVIITPILAWRIPLIVNNLQYKDLSAAQFDDPDDPLIQGLIACLTGRAAFTETITETRRNRRITGAYPSNDLLYTLYGRDSDVTALTDWLGSLERAVPIAQILGIGGVGKTRLAVEIIDKLDFRDGTIWFRFDNALSAYENSPARVAELVRDHLQLPNMEEGAAWAALNGREILIVLDNAEDCPAAQRSAFIARLRALRDGPRVLITSCYAWDELTPLACRERDLHAPSADDGIRILKRMAEVNGYAAKLIGQDAQDIAEKAFYHPRLMLYAVGWLRATPPHAIVTALATLKGGEIDKALEEMLGKTLRQMTEQKGESPLKALKRLNVTAGGFTRAAAEALLAEAVADDPLLSDLITLADWNLLDYDDGRYTIDPLVTKVAGHDETAYPSHLDFYKALTNKHNQVQDYLDLDVESANLEIAFERAIVRDPVAAYWLANVCSDFLINRGRIGQRMNQVKRVEAAFTGEEDQWVQAALQNSFGSAYWDLSSLEDRAGNLHRAIGAYTEALRFFTPNTAPLDYATTQNNLGNAYGTLAGVEDQANNLRRAIHAFKEALRFCTPEAAPLDYAMTQNNLGNAYSDLAGLEDRAGNLHRAIGAYTEALRFRPSDAAPLNYATTQNNLGTVYGDLAGLEDQASNLHRAIDAFTEVLLLWTPDTAPLNYAMTEANLGLALRDSGELAGAVACWQRAELYFRAMGWIDDANKMLKWIEDGERRLGVGRRSDLKLTRWHRV